MNYRQYWCDYFNKSGVRILFWSAKLEAEKVEDEAEKVENEAEKVEDEAEKVGKCIACIVGT